MLEAAGNWADRRSVVAERTPVRSLWFGRGMGLLEDAIREHLELKRRLGADPGEIAQKEQEALAPVVADEPATWGADHDPLTVGLEGEYDSPAYTEPEPVALEHSLEARAVEFSAVGQETAELDMSEFLANEAQMNGNGYGEGLGAAEPVRAARISDRTVEDHELDWEVAGHALGDPIRDQIAGQERLTFE